MALFWQIMTIFIVIQGIALLVYEIVMTTLENKENTNNE